MEPCSTLMSLPSTSLPERISGPLVSSMMAQGAPFSSWHMARTLWIVAAWYCTDRKIQPFPGIYEASLRSVIESHDFRNSYDRSNASTVERISMFALKKATVHAHRNRPDKESTHHAQHQETSWEPCEKFMRAQRMPAIYRPLSLSTLCVIGPTARGRAPAHVRLRCRHGGGDECELSRAGSEICS